VEVRVLIDAVGARYSVPSILGYLKRAASPFRYSTATSSWAAPALCQSAHPPKDPVVVDGRMALTGGMNIRAGFTREIAGREFARDTHFMVTGPVVADLFDISR
jgi:cardiolipin synthase